METQLVKMDAEDTDSIVYQYKNQTKTQTHPKIIDKLEIRIKC